MPCFIQEFQFDPTTVEGNDAKFAYKSSSGRVMEFFLCETKVLKKFRLAV